MSVSRRTALGLLGAIAIAFPVISQEETVKPRLIILSKGQISPQGMAAMTTAAMTDDGRKSIEKILTDANVGDKVTIVRPQAPPQRDLNALAEDGTMRVLMAQVGENTFAEPPALVADDVATLEKARKALADNGIPAAYDPIVSVDPVRQDQRGLDNEQGALFALGTAEISKALRRIKADAFWRKKHFGKEITVAVVDTGVSKHKCFGDRLLAGQALLRDANGRTNDSSDVDDRAGHGTAVAGLIAGDEIVVSGDRLAFGVAPMVKILPVRVLRADGNGYDSDAIRGAHFAIDSGAKVINMSLGPKDPTLPSANEGLWNLLVARAKEKGVLIIAASGNSHRDFPNRVGLPARLSDVVSVGATDLDSDRAAAFSTRGGAVPVLSAPGVNVISAMTKFKAGGAEGELASKLEGTSFAAPHVSGIAALLLASEGGKLDAAKFREKLLAHVDSATGGNGRGKGISQVDDSLVIGEIIPPPPPSESDTEKRLQKRIDKWKKRGYDPIDD